MGLMKASFKLVKLAVLVCLAQGLLFNNLPLRVVNFLLWVNSELVLLIMDHLPGFRIPCSMAQCRQYPPDFSLPDSFGGSLASSSQSDYVPRALPPLPDEELPSPLSVLAGQRKHAHPPVEPTSSSDKKKKKVKKEDADEPKPKAKAKAKAKSKPTASTGAGKRAGSKNYGQSEMRKIVDLAHELLPLGGRAWDDLTEKYNIWAKRQELVVRARKALYAKYNGMLKTANEKPTGDAERLQIYADILDAEAGILEKCSNGDIQDSDFDPAASDDDGDDEADIDDTRSHISIESDNDTPKPVHVSTKSSAHRTSTPSSTVLTKGFKIEAPLPPKGQRGKSRQTNATEVLSSISAALDPRVMHERDEARASHNFQIQQISFYQSENRTLMQRNMELNEKLQEERRRADAAMNELNMLRLLDNRSRNRDYDRYGSPYHRRMRTPSPSRYLTSAVTLQIVTCIHGPLEFIIPVHLIAVSVHGPLEFIVPLHLITVSVHALPNTIVLTLQDQHHLLLFVE
ncbi:hypothetical protein BT96DRAFT_1106326 [Gymnopus androsaceus JB14]|uniref:Uncharacterized protein n=1 Tax=Gymnopus androsaceus JB14 TaxID=1447944 RepID=A0A6A4GDL2_9AGAR|nr:hypothetical protein BT96DRAFT_1106326 [Gymnopus androsaceus JB14]